MTNSRSYSFMRDKMPYDSGKDIIMNIWRMKLRAGNHGDDMFPQCRERGIAAITYQAIFNTDLTRHTKRDLDPGVQGAARSSVFRFAWEIRGGDGITHLAELKICYGGNTRAAIRGAMRQLLEYNHYPSRSEAHCWWLVMDHHPAGTDREYIDVLRTKYALPLTLTWSVGADFESYPKLSAPG